MDDNNLIVFTRQNDGAKEVLEKALEAAEEFEGVIILGIKLDGSASIKPNAFDLFKQIYLVQFLQAWANRHLMEEGGY